MVANCQKEVIQLNQDENLNCTKMCINVFVNSIITLLSSYIHSNYRNTKACRVNTNLQSHDMFV